MKKIVLLLGVMILVAIGCMGCAPKTIEDACAKADKKVDKHKGSIEKYGFWGLVLFVGIPLPGTGAWTGSLIASVLEMDKKKTFLAIIIGVIMASIIMMLISFGLLRAIF